MKSVGTERFINNNFVVALPGEVIERKCFIKKSIQLINGFLFDFLSCRKAFYVRADFNVTDLEHVVKRISGESTFGDYGDNRNSEPFHKNSESSGKSGCSSVKGISRFGIHQYAGFVYFEHIFDIFEKRNIGYIFMGRGAAEDSHKFSENSGHCINGSDYS